MSKIIRYFLMTVLAFCAYMPSLVNSVEAANVVVLPLVKNIDDPDLDTNYYYNVIECIKQQNRYELIDNDAITAVIDKYTTADKLPDENALRAIAAKTGSELVVAIELKQLELEPLPYRLEQVFELHLDGYTVSYNAGLNKYQKHHFTEKQELEMGFYTRQNIAMRYFTNNVKREMHRVLGDNKIHVQKPRFGKTY